MKQSDKCFLCVQRDEKEIELAKRVGYVCPECGTVFQ